MPGEPPWWPGAAQAKLDYCTVILDRQGARQLTATVELPPGVSYLGGGNMGMAAPAATSVSGGWSCGATATGARCTHGPLGAGQTTAGYLLVVVGPAASYGVPPSLSVTSGTRP